MITDFNIFEKKDEEFIICVAKDKIRSWVTEGKQYKILKSKRKVLQYLDEPIYLLRFRGDDNKLYEIRPMSDGRLTPIPLVEYYCYPYDDVQFSNETLEEYEKRMTTKRFDL